MKKDADYFEGVEPHLIFIAKRLADATELESLFTAADIDYAVEADEYRGGVIFPSTRIGAFFYIRPETRDQAVEVMRSNGYSPAKPET